MKNTSRSVLLLLGCCAAAVAGFAAETPAAPAVIRYSFDGDDVDKEAWKIYDFAGDGQAGGKNVFYPVSWEKSGGVHDSGYIWADDTRWRIDTPEKPVSILALLVYQDWKIPKGIGQGWLNAKGGPALDLRNAQVSVYLRGDNLNKKGAKVYFWFVSGRNRWHFYGQPLEVSAEHWGDKVTFILKNDEAQWHQSWTDEREGQKVDLDHGLSNVISYGFSFVDFNSEVTGKLSMDELEIKLAQR